MKSLKEFKKWVRTRLFHKVTVLDILKYADANRDLGLCFSFIQACIHYWVNIEHFRECCELFNADEARRFGGESGCTWWWPKGVWDTGREEFLHYLIDYYKNQPPIYIKRLP